MPPINTFNGARLREALEARAITGVALAEVIDKDQSSVSSYINDHVTPPPHVVTRICDALKLPPHFFTQDSTPVDPPFLYWRSRSAATKSARASAARKYLWLRKIVGVLENYVQFPAPNMPNTSPPTDPTSISQDDIENAATALRRHWGLGDGPISNIVQLVENNGGIVTRTAIGDERLDAFSDWNDLTGHFYIVLSTDKQSAVRSRHDIVHEIGHGYLHQRKGVGSGLRPEVHKLMESQADRFASAFLLPQDTFPSEVYSISLDCLVQLKKRWKVAIASMIMRLSSLEIIDDDEKKRLLIQMSRRKWRKREPFDDEINCEAPQLLRRAVDTLIRERVVTVDTLSYAAHLPSADIERLLGLSHGHLRPDIEQEGPLLFDQAPLKFSDYASKY